MKRNFVVWPLCLLPRVVNATIGIPTSIFSSTDMLFHFEISGL